MATNLSIDPELLDKALEVSGEETKRRRQPKRWWSSSLDVSNLESKSYLDSSNGILTTTTKASVLGSGSIGRYQRLVVGAETR